MAGIPALTLTAKVLLQFPGKDPVEVGEVEIPINVTTGRPIPALQYPPGVRGIQPASYVAPPPAPTQSGGVG